MTMVGCDLHTRHQHSAMLGSTRLLTWLDGTMWDFCDYRPFGEETTGHTDTPYRFTGFERDAESALDHTWFRQYSSAQARWLSPDPLGGTIFNPQSLNRYTYVLNNPLRYTDPLGLVCYEVVRLWDGSEEIGELPQYGTRSSCEQGGGTWAPDVNVTVVVDGGGPVDIVTIFVLPATDLVGPISGGPIGGGGGGGAPDDVPLSDFARQVLTLAYFRTVHDVGCIPIPGAGLITSGAAFQLGQPVPGSKPFTTPGSSTGTSPASEMLREAVPQKLPVRVPTPVGGPGTGTPLRIAKTPWLAAVIARYLPFLGLAGAGVSAHATNQCLSSKPD